MLRAPLKTGITIDSARQGALSTLVRSASSTDSAFLGSYCDNRTTKREPESCSQEGGFEGCRGTAEGVDGERVQGHSAGYAPTSGEKLARDHHEWKQQGVPISRVDEAKPGGLQQSRQPP